MRRLEAIEEYGRKAIMALVSAVVAEELRMSYLLSAALDVNAADSEGDAAERMSNFLRRVRGSLEGQKSGR